MKIYVTGLGVVSGIGIGVSENIEALQQGKHGIGKVTLFPTALDVPVSEVKRSNEELKQLLSLPPQRTVSRTALLGMIAAKEAMEDAGLNLAYIIQSAKKSVTESVSNLAKRPATVTYWFYFRHLCRRYGFKRAFL